MWTLTPLGFFSVVRKPGDACLTIRTRVADDLDALRVRYLPTLSPTVEGAGTDYPFRATCAPEAWGEALGALGRDVDYPNFKDRVAALQGPGRARVYAGVWSQLRGLTPGRLPSAAGGVVVREDGRVCLRLSAGGHDGEGWTWAKGRPERGEAAEAAALREVREELGITAQILGAVPGAFVGSGTTTRYWLMRPMTEHGDFDRGETEAVGWFTPEEARERIRTSTRVAVKVRRDLSVLDAALAVWRELRA
jgi:8-oxo-dGTP pyrophosphatase MutT (NUDIX family)